MDQDDVNAGFNAGDGCKVLMIGTVYPFPTDTGKKVVLAGLVSYFLQRIGPREFCYAYFGKQGDAVAGPWSRLMTLGSIWSRLPGVLVDALLLRRKSIQEAALYSSQLRTQLHELILSKRPQLIVFDTIRTAQFDVPQSYTGKVVLYLEDLFSVRYRRTLDAVRDDPAVLNGILGGFGAFLPSWLARVLDRFSGVKRMLLRAEMRLVAKSEDILSVKFPGPLLLSASECETLARRAPSSSPRVFRPLLNSGLSGIYMRAFDGQAVYVFLGTLTIPANHSAITTFIDRCWHDVLALMPGAKLKIIGPGKTRLDLAALIRKYADSVEHVGFITDLAPIMSTCCAMVVPLRFGTGIKLKVLDALRYGVPIVSTRAGIDGVPVVPGQDCLVVDSIDEIPKCMYALADTDRNRVVSNAAAAFFLREYGAGPVMEMYDRIFDVRKA